MIEQISDYIFPAKPRLYNSERRETEGCISWYNNHTDHYPGIGDDVGGGEANNVQTFHITDLESTSESNMGHVTLFTYANGVTVRMSYYLESYDEQTISYYAYVNYYDKDGDRITSIDSRFHHLYTTTQYGDSVNNVTLYFSPCGVDYRNLDENLTGDLYQDTIFFYPRSSGSPYEPINLNGAYDTSERFNYYGSSVHNIYASEFSDFFDAIVEGGDGTPISPILPSDDTSEPGGGDEDDPDYDPFSDLIGFPDMPTGGDALSSGFIHAYTPSSSQLQAIARKLWSNDFYETILKINNDPMEAIISLHSIPFTMTAGQSNCVIGNYDTGISVGTLTGQFYRRHLGSIYIPEHWASALDYSPYVTIDIFLPYVGVRALQVDDIIGKRIDVEYMVDVLTGATVVHIKCGDSVLYSYNANLMMKIPITMSSMEPLLNSLKNATSSIISGATSGGGAGAIGAGVGSAINVATSKHSMVSRGSSLTGSFGCLSIFTPYLIIHRPIQSLASGFKHFKGYPSNITATIGSVSGYTEIESVHLTGIPCTDIERDEINALLYNGVIV